MCPGILAHCLEGRICIYICIQVLETRAKAYGLTVDQYKRRNLMKAEITSHDVAGVVKALAGRAFLTVTGAQVCVCVCVLKKIE